MLRASDVPNDRPGRAALQSQLLGAHFKATGWQRGMRGMGLSFVFVPPLPQPAEEESVGASLPSSMKEALMS